MEAAKVEISAAPVSVTPAKAGYKTTEFWLALLTGAATLVNEHVPPTWKAVTMAVTSAAYAIARAIAKR